MGRWFTFNKEKKEEKQKVLERGSIVNIDDKIDTSYVVSEFFKINAKNSTCHS